MILFRPTGLEELGLIYDSGLRAFPPRLPEQPIFYPVLNLGYAEQIARDWNTGSNSFAGYVTRFKVDSNYVSKFERHVIGAAEHEELWIPAEELEDFNAHIESPILIEKAFFGSRFRGYIPDTFTFAGKTATEQFLMLRTMVEDSPFDFSIEISSNAKSVFLNYRFWEQLDETVVGLTGVEKAEVLDAVCEVWSSRKPDLPLI